MFFWVKHAVLMRKGVGFAICSILCDFIHKIMFIILYFSCWWCTSKKRQCLLNWWQHSASKKCATVKMWSSPKLNWLLKFWRQLAWSGLYPLNGVLANFALSLSHWSSCKNFALSLSHCSKCPSATVNFTNKESDHKWLSLS